MLKRRASFLREKGSEDKMTISTVSPRVRRIILASSVAFSWLLANPLMPASVATSAAFAKGSHSQSSSGHHQNQGHHQNRGGKHNSTTVTGTDDDSADDDSTDTSDDDSTDATDDDVGDID
jgi:hypothetical protein